MNIITNDGLQRFYDNLLNNYHQNVNNNLPVGSIIAYSSETIPKNYMICDGSSLNKEKYSDLYKVIGNMYGSDDTMFNLPDLRNRFIYGTDSELNEIGGEAEHILTEEEIPPLDVEIRAQYGNSPSSGYLAWANTNGGDYSKYTLGKTIGGEQPHNNLPPYIKLIYIIKISNDVSIETNEILDQLKNDIINEVSLRMHPIGSIYITMDSKDPSTIYGGTWKKIEDRFLLGSSAKVMASSFGGSKTHTHTLNDIGGTVLEAKHLPSNVVRDKGPISEASSVQLGAPYSVVKTTDAEYYRGNIYSGNQPHTHTNQNTNESSNMPPYIAVNIWQRIS